MDIDPQEVVEAAKSSSNARLNAAVAVTVALLATFMGICKVKDDNIVQAMQQAQADKLDHWSFYQARNIRQEVAEGTLVQLELARANASAAQAPAYDVAITKYRELAADQARKKDELRQQAEEDQKRYDALNFRDDQFDLSDALLAIAVAMLAVTALTGLWPLYIAALAPTFFGVLMGLAGLAAWPVHPDALIKLLS
jgi:ribosomal protein S13